MAVGKLDIVNLALLRIGESPIQSLDEGSTPANAANLLYDMSRRAVLRDYDWSFAIKTAVLPFVESGSPDEKGVYACVLPSDCLRVVEVLRCGDSGSFFRSEWFRVYGGRIYVRDHKPLVKYVRDEENVDLYDSKFIEAFSYKLAGELAMAVRQSESMMTSMLNAYQSIVSQASEESQNEHDPSLSENPYVEVRYGY